MNVTEIYRKAIYPEKFDEIKQQQAHLATELVADKLAREEWLRSEYTQNLLSKLIIKQLELFDSATRVGSVEYIEEARTLRKVTKLIETGTYDY